MVSSSFYGVIKDCKMGQCKKGFFRYQITFCLIREHVWYWELLIRGKKLLDVFSPYGVLKLNADGAAHGKPGPAGIGCVLRNHTQYPLLSFSPFSLSFSPSSLFSLFFSFNQQQGSEWWGAGDHQGVMVKGAPSPSSLIDTGANRPDLINHVINQSLDYIDRLNRSQGSLVHLYWGSTKQIVWNHELDGPNQCYEIRFVSAEIFE